MIYLQKATTAKINSDIYNRALIHKELKSIIHTIHSFSKKGYTGLKWRGDINEKNLKILRKLGYKVINTSYCIYEIKW